MNKTKFGNKRKGAFLNSILTKSFDNEDDRTTILCKFNFSYFTVQDAGQNFDQWSEKNLIKLLESLKSYSQFPLSHWENQSVGKSGTVLAIYNKFPHPSDFKKPSHVPHQAMWGRFRLSSGIRLIGFTIPKTYDGKIHPKTAKPYDCNTFYVVFLDENHVFWKVGESK